MFNKFRAAGLCLMLLTGTAQAAIDGETLAELCEDVGSEELNKTGGHLACMTYVAGVIDGHGYGYVVGVKTAADYLELPVWEHVKIPGGLDARNGFCWPGDVDAFHLARVVNKYLDDHPESLHHGALGLVMEALTDAFGEPPCD